MKFSLHVQLLMQSPSWSTQFFLQCTCITATSSRTSKFLSEAKINIRIVADLQVKISKKASKVSRPHYNVFKSIHSGECFRKAPFSVTEDDGLCSVDERPNRFKNYPFSNENGLVHGRGLRGSRGHYEKLDFHPHFVISKKNHSEVRRALSTRPFKHSPLGWVFI